MKLLLPAKRPWLREFVAQVSNLLYRRLPAGRRVGRKQRTEHSATFAGWKPAIQQIGNLRYGSSASAHLCPQHFDFSKLQPRNSGFILVAVFVLIMLASMVALSLLFRLKAEGTAAAAGAGAEQAWAAAMSGVQEAMRVAAAATPGSDDWRNQPRAFRDRFVCDDGADRWFFTVYSPPDDDALAELRFGLTDEAAKLNLNAAHATNFTGFPRLTAQHIAALRDFLDADDVLQPEGAEQEFYSPLPQPYAVRNGPLNTLDELLLIRGFTPALLHGEDANMNWRLDPNENDGDERLPADNNDGRLDLGLQPLLTVSSYDPNDDNDFVPRTNLNDPTDPLPGIELPPALTNFIAALRTNPFKLSHAAELLEAKFKVKDSAGKETEIASGIGKEELALVLDLFSAGADERSDGLVNINTASVDVLTSVPGLDAPLAESILSTRRSISPERRTTIAWLYQEGVVDAARFKSIAPFLTARSYQYSFRVVGFGLPSGRFRVLDVVIDLAPYQPVVTYLRDITRLGLPFKLEPEGQAGEQVGKWESGKVGMRRSPTAPESQGRARRSARAAFENQSPKRRARTNAPYQPVPLLGTTARIVSGNSLPPAHFPTCSLSHPPTHHA